MKTFSHDNRDCSLLIPDALPKVVYTRDSIRRQGWRIWGAMIRELLDNREIIWRLILRDISARYRQSLLGYVWAILPSAIAVSIFTLLVDSRTIPISETPLPYVVYALWNIGVWQLFAGCLMTCTSSLTSAGPLVTKVNFPKEALVAAAIGQPFFDFAIRLVPVILVFTWHGIVPKWQSVFLPLTLIPALLLAVGLGFVLSITNLVLRDVGNILSTALTFGMFLAPVLYPPPVDWPLSLINIVNPFSPLLIASQDLIAYGSLTMPRAFLFSCLFSTLVFLLGWRFFHLAIPRVSQHA